MSDAVESASVALLSAAEAVIFVVVVWLGLLSSARYATALIPKYLYWDTLAY